MPNDVLIRIRAENLGVYRASRIRLREDVSQEDEVAANYRGRLVYELLQNADDAMAGAASASDRITFRLTDSDLWVGNSGRPLTDADVEGLCGIGASSKGDSQGRRRASIGHKGMGFKSVLEITAEPQAISEEHSFRLGADLAYDEVAGLFDELGESRPRKVPAMRFPYGLEEQPAYWKKLQNAGIRTLFRFPLRPDLTEDVRTALAERLLSFPVTSILFLKHLEHVDIEVERAGSRQSRSWQLTRERRSNAGWAPCTGLEETGLFRVHISSDDDDATFILAHDADVEIGPHRGGLSSQVWEGIELSEVSVAARVENDRPVPIPTAWQVFHIFLPTAEACPYPLLVNGAFASDLSRRGVPVASDHGDYNRHLLRCVARVFRDELVPGLQRDGASMLEILQLLNRDSEPGEPCEREAAQSLYEAMREELAGHPFLPIGETAERLPLRECIVPPLVSDDTVGADLRDLLGSAAQLDGRHFPSREVCTPPYATIAVDHGAAALTPAEVPALLAATDLDQIRLEEDPSGGFYVDPVLRVLERLWGCVDAWDFAEAVQAQPLFPVSQAEGVVERVTTLERDCFYPPRALKGTVPLQNLSFLMQEVCWGALTPVERTTALRDQMTAWQGLFNVREFKFPDVMRASVLPALTLEVEADDPLRQSLCQIDALAAICQLSGRTPNPAAPLPYERLGPNRALINLARLPVPCRGIDGGPIEWHPAYTVYLGEDWIGQESIEHVLRSIESTGAQAPSVPILVAPSEMVGRLANFSHLQDEDEVEADEGDGDDEVDIAEDEDEALDTDERERWLRFLTWLGVNRGLRAIPFHDVEDRSSGWLTTKNLSRPTGRAFRHVPEELWAEYRMKMAAVASEHASSNADAAYFYRLHDLDYAATLLDAAAEDETNAVARALFEHLAINWPRLQRYAHSELAVVPFDKQPSRRNHPPRALAEELVEAGEDFWLWRLRGRDVCPTSHGPRPPRRVWLRTGEIERRFGRRGSDPAQLLPLLELSPEFESGKADQLARALGVRAELTPSTFQPEDALLLLERLRDVWNGVGDENRERALRQVIRPAYRNLIELLPGADDQSRPGYFDGALQGAPLLVQNGNGEYRFEHSQQVLWAQRSGTQDRLGRPTDLWTFVLEAMPGARSPLTRLLGVRVLEDQLSWHAEPGESALDPALLPTFRSGLRDLAPYLLARLAADRADERLASGDARRLRDFVEAVEPVSDLAVRCELDGRETDAGMRRTAFGLPPRPGQEMQAFVVWGGNPWPPDSYEAERVAQALCDCLEVTTFEAFLALLTASSEESRLRLLELAGAPTDLAAMRDSFLGGGSEDSATEGDSLAISKTPGEVTGEQGSSPSEPTEPRPGAGLPKTQLYGQDQLIVLGVPVEVRGSEPRREAKGSNGSRPSGRNGQGRYGGRTDLSELDNLGMHVVLTFERERLRHQGNPEAAIFEEGGDPSNALVFDVSTLGAIDAARERSPRFVDALKFLQSRGLDANVPGFDVLTLKASTDAESIDRLIELKSSGERAHTQDMSWNEWKTAQNSELRQFFFLYLVGNLRRDLTDALPFLRAVRDPFGALWAQERNEFSKTRKVRLDLDAFDLAEEEKLGVRKESPTSEKDQADGSAHETTAPDAG